MWSALQTHPIHLCVCECHLFFSFLFLVFIIWCAVATAAAIIDERYRHRCHLQNVVIVWRVHEVYRLILNVPKVKVKNQNMRYVHEFYDRKFLFAVNIGHRSVYSCFLASAVAAADATSLVAIHRSTFNHNNKKNNRLSLSLKTCFTLHLRSVPPFDWIIRALFHSHQSHIIVCMHSWVCNLCARCTLAHKRTYAERSTNKILSVDVCAFLSFR